MQDNFKKLEDMSVDELIRIAEQDIITAPHYLKDDIVEKSQSIQIQLPMQIEVHTRQISKRMLMFFYTMKISAAMICTLILLLVVPNIHLNIDKSYQGIKQPIETTRTEISNVFMEQRSDFRESVDRIKENIKQTFHGGNENE